MFRLILGFFGYVKIPREAVQLSVRIEDTCRIVEEEIPRTDLTEGIYKNAQTLTQFLRSGRML